MGEAAGAERPGDLAAAAAFALALFGAGAGTALPPALVVAPLLEVAAFVLALAAGRRARRAGNRFGRWAAWLAMATAAAGFLYVIVVIALYLAGAAALVWLTGG